MKNSLLAYKPGEEESEEVKRRNGKANQKEKKIYKTKEKSVKVKQNGKDKKSDEINPKKNK